MRYEVPQFIDVEDKIIGPFSFTQFIYVAGGGGFFVVLYLNLPFFFAILLGAPVVLLGVALAFYKINNRPLILSLEAALKYFTRRRLYLWKHVKQTPNVKQIQNQQEIATMLPKISENKLKDLAWNLDVRESLYTDKSQRK